MTISLGIVCVMAVLVVLAGVVTFARMAEGDSFRDIWWPKR